MTARSPLFDGCAAKPSRRRTFWEGEQVIVPNTIRVRPNVFTIRTIHHADVRSLSIDHCEEGVRFGLDRNNHLLARPPRLRTAQMRDALVGISAILLGDAGN